MGEVYLDKNLCIHCKKCIEICPINALVFENKFPAQKFVCMGCSFCETECPVSAIRVDRVALKEVF